MVSSPRTGIGRAALGSHLRRWGLEVLGAAMVCCAALIAFFLGHLLSDRALRAAGPYAAFVACEAEGSEPAGLFGIPLAGSTKDRLSSDAAPRQSALWSGSDPAELWTLGGSAASFREFERWNSSGSKVGLTRKIYWLPTGVKAMVRLGPKVYGYSENEDGRWLWAFEWAITPIGGVQLWDAPYRFLAMAAAGSKVIAFAQDFDQVFWFDTEGLGTWQGTWWPSIGAESATFDGGAIWLCFTGENSDAAVLEITRTWLDPPQWLATDHTGDLQSELQGHLYRSIAADGTAHVLAFSTAGLGAWSVGALVGAREHEGFSGDLGLGRVSIGSGPSAWISYGAATPRVVEERNMGLDSLYRSVSFDGRPVFVVGVR